MISSGWLNALELIRGDEDPTDGRMSMMEAVARHAGVEVRNAAGESDWPATASIVLGCFFSQWNDALDDEQRQRLKAYVPRLVGTRAGDAVERERRWAVRDWYVRTMLPIWLEVGGFREPAAALRAEPPLASDPDAVRVAGRVEAIAGAIRSQFLERREEAGLMVWLATSKTAKKALGDAAGTAGRDTVASTLYERLRGWEPEEVWENLGAQVHDAAAQSAELVALEAHPQQRVATERLAPAIAECQASAYRLIDQLIGLR